MRTSINMLALIGLILGGLVGLATSDDKKGTPPTYQIKMSPSSIQLTQPGKSYPVKMRGSNGKYRTVMVPVGYIAVTGPNHGLFIRPRQNLHTLPPPRDFKLRVVWPKKKPTTVLVKAGGSVTVRPDGSVIVKEPHKRRR